MGTMGEVPTDYRDPEEDQWMEQQSSARLFERSRIKVLAGSLFFCSLPFVLITDESGRIKVLI